jgi:hypothetical protein
MAKKIWATGSYWVGVVMALACFATVLAGNTELLWRFEHRGFPLSWIFAGVTIVAFLAAEFGPSDPVADGEEVGSLRLAPEYETADY